MRPITSGEWKQLNNREWKLVKKINFWCGYGVAINAKGGDCWQHGVGIDVNNYRCLCMVLLHFWYVVGATGPWHDACRRFGVVVLDLGGLDCKFLVLQSIHDPWISKTCTYIAILKKSRVHDPVCEK